MLKWGDIDFGERLLFVRNKPEYDYHTKSYEPRTVPLKENAFNALSIQKMMVPIPVDMSFQIVSGEQGSTTF